MQPIKRVLPNLIFNSNTFEASETSTDNISKQQQPKKRFVSSKDITMTIQQALPVNDVEILKLIEQVSAIGDAAYNGKFTELLQTDLHFRCYVEIET